MSKTTTVILAGGLGNQLFQFSAAYSIGRDGEVQLDRSLGYPRLNETGDPEISSFHLPGRNVIPAASKKSWLPRKCVGFNIRINLNPKRYESNFFFKLVIKISTNVIMRLFFGKKYFLEVARDLGFYLMSPVEEEKLLVGYFQSYKWANHDGIRQDILNIRLKTHSNAFSSYYEKILIDNPVVIHIRRGDYLSEDKFGVLSDDYYRMALAQLSEEADIKKIWLFTDARDSVLSSLPDSFRAKTFVVPTDKITTSETLELMRYGSSYVIANSSFSWWGAYLRKNQLAPVYAPMKWFKGMSDPTELLPPDWRIVKLENPFSG